MSIRLEKKEDWAELELRRPPRNLLDGEMLAALLAAFDELEASGSPTLLLKAQGKHFSTGYPVDAIPEAIFHADPDLRATAPFEQVMARLAGYAAPVVAAVQGDVYGGAVELLCCTDLRIGAHDIRIALPAVRLGLVYSLTGLRRITWCMGSSFMTEMLLTGEPISARRLLRAGWLHRLVAPGKLDVTCEVMLESLCKGAPLALRGTRRSLRRLAEAEALPAELLAELYQLRHESWLSEDFREAQAAFVEKRRPNFKGR